MTTPTRIGFTGTRRGMTLRQQEAFIEGLKTVNPKEFHHGDCYGADAQAHAIVRKLYPYPQCVIHVHPTKDGAQRAFCKADFYHQPQPPLERNRDIVDAVELMFGAPYTNKEELRSGTWMTIRYTNKRKKPLLLLTRNGQN